MVRRNQYVACPCRVCQGRGKPRAPATTNRHIAKFGLWDKDGDTTSSDFDDQSPGAPDHDSDNSEAVASRSDLSDSESADESVESGLDYDTEYETSDTESGSDEDDIKLPPPQSELDEVWIRQLCRDLVVMKVGGLTYTQTVDVAAFFDKHGGYGLSPQRRALIPTTWAQVMKWYNIHRYTRFSTIILILLLLCKIFVTIQGQRPRSRDDAGAPGTQLPAASHGGDTG